MRRHGGQVTGTQILIQSDFLSFTNGRFNTFLSHWHYGIRRLHVALAGMEYVLAAHRGLQRATPRARVIGNPRLTIVGLVVLQSVYGVLMEGWPYVLTREYVGLLAEVGRILATVGRSVSRAS